MTPIVTILGPYTAQVAQRLKELNYAGNALFINSIASSAQQRSRTKPRSNSSPNIKAKQKASQENTSFPDDGMDDGIEFVYGRLLTTLIYRCLAYRETVTSYHHPVKDRRMESSKTWHLGRCTRH